jgi:hypothetical protein
MDGWMDGVILLQKNNTTFHVGTGLIGTCLCEKIIAYRANSISEFCAILTLGLASDRLGHG